MLGGYTIKLFEYNFKKVNRNKLQPGDILYNVMEERFCKVDRIIEKHGNLFFYFYVIYKDQSYFNNRVLESRYHSRVIDDKIMQKFVNFNS